MQHSTAKHLSLRNGSTVSSAGSVASSAFCIDRLLKEETKIEIRNPVSVSRERKEAAILAVIVTKAVKSSLVF
jgi:hypothetical protein